jgi:hypothetical protein
MGDLSMPYYIHKSSGETELFDTQKLRVSLEKAGTPESLITHIVHEIYRQKPHTSNQIHELVIRILEDQHEPIAARYNLKRALMELGPAGYPFEKFVGHLLEEMGYQVKVDQIVQGFCVEHEVDVLAQKDAQRIMIECKFHNQSGLKSDVKVTLYIQARFEDIHEYWSRGHDQDNPEIHHAWIFTNTRFTEPALRYAACKDIRLTSWSFPAGKGIAQLVDTFGLHPITALTTLTHRQKRLFIQNGLVLCKDVTKNKDLLTRLRIPEHAIQKLMQESQAVCAIPHQK